ncbi:Crp/Fnr family transcriptional regulator, partial [Streptomyces sp. NPDC006356]
QHMYDNYAEALDDTVVCVMSRADVHKYLLSDARIAARITAILGRRLVADLEQRLSDSVFKTVALGVPPACGGASPPHSAP